MTNLPKKLANRSIALILSLILLGLAITSQQNGENVSDMSSLRKPHSHKFECLQGLYTLVEEDDAAGCDHLSDFSQTIFVSQYTLFKYIVIKDIDYCNPIFRVPNKYKKSIIPLRS